MNKNVDIIYFHEHSLYSLRELIEGESLLKNDVIKQTVGLSLVRGLDLETLVLKLSGKNAYITLSYQGRPIEDEAYSSHQITGVVFEVFSQTPIHLRDIHPITEAAFYVISGAIQSVSDDSKSPDWVFKKISEQLLDYAEMMFLKNPGGIEGSRVPKLSGIKFTPYEKDLDISRKRFRVTGMYSINLLKQKRQKDSVEITEILPESVGFYGERLDQFGDFLHLLVPFLTPAEQIKNALLSSRQALKLVGIDSKTIDFLDAMFLPYILIFNDSGRYRVLLCKLHSSIKSKTLKVVTLEEDPSSNVGYSAIHSNFERREWDFEILNRQNFNFSIKVPQSRVVCQETKKNSLTGEEELTELYSIDEELIDIIRGGGV